MFIRSGVNVQNVRKKTKMEIWPHFLCSLELNCPDSLCILSHISWEKLRVPTAYTFWNKHETSSVSCEALFWIFLIFEEREIFHIKNGGQTDRQRHKIAYRVAPQLKSRHLVCNFRMSYKKWKLSCHLVTKHSFCHFLN